MAKTLFPYPDIYIEHFQKRFSIEISKEFVSCLDRQLTNSFESQTGIKPGKRIEIAWASPSVFFYTQDKISRYAAELWVNNQNSAITIAWESSSGKIYSLTDKEIDCDDIRFWLEDLQPLLYARQLNPGSSVPLELKDLSFDLVVERLGNDAIIEMHLHPEAMNRVDEIITATDNFISGLNERSEKKNRADGVIHNWQRNIENDLLVYKIDLGSAGVPALKKILQYISTTNSVLQIKII